MAGAGAGARAKITNKGGAGTEKKKIISAPQHWIAVQLLHSEKSETQNLNSEIQEIVNSALGCLICYNFKQEAKYYAWHPGRAAVAVHSILYTR